MKRILVIMLAMASSAYAAGMTSADTTNKGMPASGSTHMPNATLADTESAKVLLTINEGEIAAAKIAETKAKNADVKNFATMMANVHETNKNETNTLVSAQAITPKDSEMSKMLDKDAAEKNKSISKMSGTSFDKAYMDEQVAMHEKALKVLDDKLIPSAKNGEYKAHLQTTRTAVAEHLGHARELRKKL